MKNHNSCNKYKELWMLQVCFLKKTNNRRKASTEQFSHKIHWRPEKYFPKKAAIAHCTDQSLHVFCLLMSLHNKTDICHACNTSIHIQTKKGFILQTQIFQFPLSVKYRFLLGTLSQTQNNCESLKSSIAVQKHKREIRRTDSLSHHFQ